MKMNCFGDIERIFTTFDESFAKHHRRYACNKDDSEIIVTESPNLVTKYRMHHKHMTSIQSWSFDELNRLSVPLTYSDINDSNRFVGVHSCNTLIEWCLDDTNQELRKDFSKNFHYPIINLLLPNRFKEPLLIFFNGWARNLSTAKIDKLDLEFDSVIENDEKIIAIESLCLKKNRLAIYYIVSDTNENLFVYKCIFNDNMFSKMSRSAVKRQLDAWTVFPLHQHLIGATKVNDQILVFPLDPPIEKSSSIFKFESPCFETLCSMVICKSGAMCLLGKKSDGDFVIDVYETKYSIKIGSLNLQNKMISVNHFYAINDNLLVTCKNQIMVVPIINQRLSLSQLLTKSLTRNSVSPQQDDYDNIKKENYQNFIKNLGLDDTDPSISVDKVKEINKRFDVISSQKEIPEEIIVSLLNLCTQHYLRTENNEEIHDELTIFFKKLIELPYNEVFLISCLKSSTISTDQYLLSIELLLDNLPSSNCLLLTWISVLIDVNYNKFIIRPSPKVIETLCRIQEKVGHNIEFFKLLGSTKTLIQSLDPKNRRYLDPIRYQSRDKGQYCIELMTFI